MFKRDISSACRTGTVEKHSGSLSSGNVNGRYVGARIANVKSFEFVQIVSCKFADIIVNRFRGSSIFGKAIHQIFRCVLLSACVLPVYAHTGGAMSVPDAVTGALKRITLSVPAPKRAALTPDDTLPLLTSAQRHALATQYIRFEVNQPVMVRIARDTRWGDQPFWLRSTSFKKTSDSFKEAATTFDVWEKEFPAGAVGLGVNSLTGGGIHYVLGVRASNENVNQPLVISNLYPKQLRLQTAGEPIKPFVDNRYILESMPGPLEGHQLVRLLYDRRDQGKLLNVLHNTKFPSQAKPDQWVLTWADDPRTTQTLQWRTNTEISRLDLSVTPTTDPKGFESAQAIQRTVEANVLASPTTVNDPVNHRYAVTFRGLKPATPYQYAWRASNDAPWQQVGQFITAPERATDFSFLYLGDAQNGLATWGELITQAEAKQPSARFVLMAGDLVDRGNDRDDWDAFFAAANGVFARRTLVPVIGNHENQGGQPALYLSLFNLLENGPRTIAPERAYSFEYGDALFVILDTNIALAAQADWLEKTLAASKAHWKFVSYHHPAYPSSGRKVDPDFQRKWLPLFDRYGVDFALQGHDHAYLRTYPMKAGKVVLPSENADIKPDHVGTRYLISVSGTKMYPQNKSYFIEKGFAKVATYQVFELAVTEDRLTYRAFDGAGKVKDALVVVKPR